MYKTVQPGMFRECWHQCPNNGDTRAEQQQTKPNVFDKWTKLHCPCVPGRLQLCIYIYVSPLASSMH